MKVVVEDVVEKIKKGKAMEWLEDVYKFAQQDYANVLYKLLSQNAEEIEGSPVGIADTITKLIIKIELNKADIRIIRLRLEEILKDLDDGDLKEALKNCVNCLDDSKDPSSKNVGECLDELNKFSAHDEVKHFFEWIVKFFKELLEKAEQHCHRFFSKKGSENDESAPEPTNNSNTRV